MIYLDNAATTMPAEEVCNEVQKYMKNYWANPSSSHSKGIESRLKFEEIKNLTAKITGTSKNCIFFTSGATESINTVLKGFWNAYPRAGKHLITCETEHPATLEVCKILKTSGIDVTYLPVDSKGCISMDKLKNAIRPDTSIISLLLVNNETGSLLDLKKLIAAKNEINPDIKIHLDAVQAFGKIPEKFITDEVDYISCSAHKLHGPKGAGILIKNKKSKIFPLIHGGGQQENKRSGTVDLPSAAGFCTAIRQAYEKTDENYKKVSVLRKKVIDELSFAFPDMICNSPEHSSPYILNLSLSGIMSEVLVRMLEARDIYISTSSACKSTGKNTSHVLSAMKIRDDYLKGTVRISFSHYNTMSQIDIFCKAFIQSVNTLKIQTGRK